MSAINTSIYGYLRVFHAIASEGSIVGASRKLNIASPSISQSLKLLEQHIGLPLFIRTTRQLKLTEAGERLLAETVAPLNHLATAVENVQQLGDEPVGTVRITLAKVAYELLLKPHFAEFCQRYPHILLEIALSDAMVDVIGEGIDLGIRFGNVLDEQMVAKELFPAQRMGLYASSDYVAKNGLPESIAQLQQHPFLTYRFSSSSQISPLELRTGNEPFSEQIEVKMPIKLISNHIDVIQDAIRQGLGIGRLFEPLAPKEFVPVLEEHWISYPPLYLYYAQHSQKAKRVKVLVDFLLEKLKGKGSDV